MSRSESRSPRRPNIIYPEIQDNLFIRAHLRSNNNPMTFSGITSYIDQLQRLLPVEIATMTYKIMSGKFNIIYGETNIVNKLRGKPTGFFYFALILQHDKNSHFNILRVKWNGYEFIIERFEPYGSSFMTPNVNKVFDNSIKVFFQEKLEHIVVVRSIENTCPATGVQMLENRNRIQHTNKKSKNCVLWGMWFFELCIRNPEYGMLELNKGAKNRIPNFFEYILAFKTYLAQRK